MNVRAAVTGWIALLLLAMGTLGCNGFFVDENTTVSFPVYVANSGSSSISAYKLDPNSGALTAVTGSPFTSGVNPTALGTNTTGAFLYSANLGSGASNGGVSGWVVNTDGTLTGINGSPFLIANSYASIAVDPQTRFVFAGGGATADIQGFTIASGSGILTGLGGTTGTTGVPIRMAEDPAGKFLYVAEGASGVDAFTISNAGALANVQNVPLGGANGLAVTSKYVYVADSATGVNAYSINTGTGQLTAIGAALAAGTNPSNVAITPNGKYVYVTNSGSNDVSGYSVDGTTGALTEITGSPFAASTAPSAVTVDPSSRYVYVTNKSASSISIFTIDSTGKLVSAGTTNTGSTPNDVVIAP